MIHILSWTTKKHKKKHFPGHCIQSWRKFKDFSRKNGIQGLFKTVWALGSPNFPNKVEFCTFLCISLVFSQIQKRDCPDFRSPEVDISVFSTYFVSKYFNLTESPVNWFSIRVVYVFISVNLEMKRDALPRKQCTTIITQKKLAL